jgi:aspartyl protease family protein
MKYLLLIVFFKTSSLFSQVVIKLEKAGGVYRVPCSVNGVPMKFIFDTGASQVSISLTEALFMYKSGLLSDNEILGKQSFQDATGSISEGTIIRLRSLSIGGLKIQNVEASVVHNLEAPLLLGQSALSKLGTFTLNPENGTLTFHSGKDEIINENQSKAIEYYNKGFEKLRDCNSVDDVNQSLNYFSMAIMKYPDFHEAYWARAQLTYKYFGTNGKYIPNSISYRGFTDDLIEQIETDFLRSIEIDDFEKRSSWLLDLCDYYEFFEKYDSLEIYAEKFKSLNPFNFEIFYYLTVSKNYEIDSDNQKILDYGYKYIKFSKNIKSKIYIFMGEAYMRQDQCTLAILKFEECIKKSPEIVMAYVNIAKCYLSNGDLSNALKILNSKGMIFDPNGDDPYEYSLVKGIVLFEMKKYKESIKELEYINDAFAYKSNRHYFYIGYCNSELGNFDLAIVNYTKAILADSLDFNSYNNRGYLKIKLKQFVEARADIEKSILLNPKSYLAIDSRGELNFMESKFSSCIKDMTTAIELNPQSSNSYFFRGRAYIALENPILGCQDLKKAEALGEKDASNYIKKLCKN